MLLRNVAINLKHYTVLKLEVYTLNKHPPPPYTKEDFVAFVYGCRCELVSGYGKIAVFPTSTTAHNSHKICVRVVPPEDWQVMPESYRYFKP
jgi:hypothetical protein